MELSKGLPAEVMNTIHEAVTILDNEYGDNREDSDDGGFVLVIESKAELTALLEISMKASMKNTVKKQASFPLPKPISTTSKAPIRS